MKMRKYKAGDDECVRRACEHLAQARDLLAYADAPKATAKVRSALKSAEGAYRHVRRRQLYPEIEALRAKAAQ